MKVTGLICGLLISLNIFAQDLVAKAEVMVTDFDDHPIPDAEIFCFDTKAEKILSGKSGADGKFTINLKPGKYNIRLKARGRTKDYTFIEIPTLKENEDYGTVQIMIQYEEQSSFVLSDLHFETNKDVIQSQSYKELDELSAYLKTNVDLEIEIAGYTDSDGSDESNLDLSQRRAEAVKNYLIKRGVNASRMSAKGYGENQPIADNSSEMGKALNRRTEIHILDTSEGVE